MATTGQPDGAPVAEIGRRRTLLLAGAIAGLLVASAGIAFLSHNAGSANGHAAAGASLPIVARSPETTAAKHVKPKATTTVTPPRTAVAQPTTTVPFLFFDTTPPTAPPETTTSIPPASTTTPPTSILLPAETITLPPGPPPFGANRLTWTAPKTLQIVEGKTALLTVTAHNPTDREVSMPHPLACAPRMDHGEICSDQVQLIAAGKSASATLTIDATGFVPGHYTLIIEGVLTVNVTVS